jgi:hypothetical protein
MPIIKNIIQAFKLIAELDCLEKRAFAVGSEFFVGKIGEMKYGVPIKEMMIISCEVVGPKFVSN